MGGAILGAAATRLLLNSLGRRPGHSVSMDIIMKQHMQQQKQLQQQRQQREALFAGTLPAPVPLHVPAYPGYTHPQPVGVGAVPVPLQYSHSAANPYAGFLQGAAAGRGALLTPPGPAPVPVYSSQPGWPGAHQPVTNAWVQGVPGAQRHAPGHGGAHTQHSSVGGNVAQVNGHFSGRGGRGRGRQSGQHQFPAPRGRR